MSSTSSDARPKKKTKRSHPPSQNQKPLGILLRFPLDTFLKASLPSLRPCDPAYGTKPANIYHTQVVEFLGIRELACLAHVNKSLLDYFTHRHRRYFWEHAQQRSKGLPREPKNMNPPTYGIMIGYPSCRTCGAHKDKARIITNFEALVQYCQKHFEIEMKTPTEAQAWLDEQHGLPDIVRANILRWASSCPDDDSVVYYPVKAKAWERPFRQSVAEEILNHLANLNEQNPESLVKFVTVQGEAAKQRRIRGQDMGKVVKKLALGEKRQRGGTQMSYADWIKERLIALEEWDKGDFPEHVAEWRQILGDCSGQELDDELWTKVYARLHPLLLARRTQRYRHLKKHRRRVLVQYYHDAVKDQRAALGIEEPKKNRWDKQTAKEVQDIEAVLMLEEVKFVINKEDIGDDDPAWIVAKCTIVHHVAHTDTTEQPQLV